MKELQLKNGAHVRVRPVPPHVIIQFNRNVSKALPPEPKPPQKAVTMADGHVEQDAVATDSPEWIAYQAERAAWGDECNSQIVDANDEYNVLQRDYAIIEWSFDGEHWRNDVPPDWTLPEALARAGLQSCGNDRVDFIGIELLTTGDDWTAVRNVAEGMANVTDEEAARVRAGFRTGSERTRDASPQKVGWLRRLAHKISRRNAGGAGVELDA